MTVVEVLDNWSHWCRNRFKKSVNIHRNVKGIHIFVISSIKNQTLSLVCCVCILQVIYIYYCVYVCRVCWFNPFGSNESPSALVAGNQPSQPGL